MLDIDYKKYLGPDWVPTDQPPSTIISNHQSFYDILVHMFFQMPSHVASSGTKNIPCVGKCAEMYGCLFVSRTSNDSKKDMFTQIKERQEQAEKGLYPPLIIYAEGGTSNGRQLLQFKKGGFINLKSVQPVVINYDCNKADMENCVIKIQHIIPQYARNLWIKVTVKRFPVFVPNDYFFDKFQQEGEEKWQTYARVIRDIMSEHTGLKKSDLSYEDKVAYKKLLYS